MPQGVSLFCSRPCTQSPLCAQSVPMSVTAPSSPPAPRSRLALYLDLIRFNRPAGWLVLIWPTLTALWVAADGFPGWHLLLVFGLGTVLMRSACLFYTSDAADDMQCVDLGGWSSIKKKK